VMSHFIFKFLDSLFNPKRWVVCRKTMRFQGFYGQNTEGIVLSFKSQRNIF
jgi:hypothetical protein